MSLRDFAKLSDKLQHEKILLVGGAGFIGHNLALELSKQKAQVLIADNLMQNSLVTNVFNAEQINEQNKRYQDFLLSRFQLLKAAGVHLRNCDARSVLDLEKVFTEFKPTKVVHLAAISSAVEAKLKPDLCFDLQLVTLRNSLELARKYIKHVNQFMFMSSSTIYGDFDGDEVDEQTPLNPRGIYANAKLMGEQLVNTYQQQYGLGTTIIRPSALYGERCVSRRVSQVFLENAITGKPLRLEGGGDGKLDFTYITDLTQGLVRALALHNKIEDSNTFNITFGKGRSIAELVEIIQSVIPNVIVEQFPRAEDKPIRGTLSIDRAKSILGFEPEWPIEVGYKNYCQWYLNAWQRP